MVGPGNPTFWHVDPGKGIVSTIASTLRKLSYASQGGAVLA